jgi:hypothetical protein
MEGARVESSLENELVVNAFSRDLGLFIFL